MKLKFIISLIIFLIFQVPVLSRAPAVDPVIGISIDDEPKQTTQNPSSKRPVGYQFKNQSSNKSNSQKKVVNNLEDGNTDKSEGLNMKSLMVISLLLLLPFALWFIITRLLPTKIEKLEEPSNYDDFDDVA